MYRPSLPDAPTIQTLCILQSYSGHTEAFLCRRRGTWPAVTSRTETYRADACTLVVCICVDCGISGKASINDSANDDDGRRLQIRCFIGDLPKRSKSKFLLRQRSVCNNCRWS